MITLRNPGHLEIELITTMGAHVKETGSYYGRFGTGMKYAIAVLLRNNIDFDLCIGTNKYEFYTEQKTIRGKEFQMCHMHSQYDSTPLGFTTELGRDWELWQAYRELYTNAVFDEDGGELHNHPIAPEDGYTMFRIYDEIPVDGVFLRDTHKEPIFTSDEVDIYEGKSDYLYYQGIRAKDLNRPSIYTYDIKRHCDLTEDRQLAYNFEIMQALATAIVSMSDELMIARMLNAKDRWFESRIDFSEALDKNPSTEFTTVYHNSPESKRNHTAMHVIPKTEPAAQSVPLREQFLQSLTDLCEDFNVEYILLDDKVEIELP